MKNNIFKLISKLPLTNMNILKPIIGKLFYHGEYLPKNIRLECECFFHHDKNPTIAYYLGLIFENGTNYIPKNVEKAIFYYKIAAMNIFNTDANERLYKLTHNYYQHPAKCVNADHYKYVSGVMYRCYTCGIIDRYCICSYCAKNCHSGHDIVVSSYSENMECDCMKFTHSCLSGRKGPPPCRTLLELPIF
ncbi:hypothetical protein TRFO_22025 [Tritrichomonas foetus]|uniref:UBR-type domain-containing protein n=1 Tax=Tritrichomonas foetus TaxID=1144522 RepID=A0A1J4KCP4_9EUKA|nr:hypothetical protein TRFO_22025 [Tritrichomonas foetus]|eukprot:OHT09193.1 hypothetical protein TRFO_22025 [Tritrichomonas foetus]